MDHTDTKRISRLIAILTELQTKRLLAASELASKFSVSIRIIYRDIRTLEQAGIPIITEEGKGYVIMEYYRLPPIMFTESQANALILAEQLVLKINKTDICLFINYFFSYLKHFPIKVSKIRLFLLVITKSITLILSLTLGQKL